jgi:hypothetical protein
LIFDYFDYEDEEVECLYDKYRSITRIPIIEIPYPNPLGEFQPLSLRYHKRPEIRISSQLFYNWKRISVLLHEVGHWRCWKEHCGCFSCHRNTCELHAFSFQIKTAMEEGLALCVKNTIKWLEVDQWGGNHKIAIRRLKSSELWNRALDYEQKN